MKILWLLLLLHSATSQPGFGRSYLRNSRLCHQWSCVNTKLGLPDALPPREQTAAVLQRLLPSGPWQGVIQPVLETCYNSRPRRYTNTCPGQALLHCVMDQLVQYCPEESIRKDDYCTPVSSIAGLNYMFSLSMYQDMEQSLSVERRPAWFLKNYFSTKCCQVPALINRTMLLDCGFASMLHIYSHDTKLKYPHLSTQSPIAPKPAVQSSDTVKTVSLKDAQNNEDSLDNFDPLDCCDMSEFIQPSWRSECHFKLTWDSASRLGIDISSGPTTTPAPTTTTAKVERLRDIMIVPQECSKETCVFKKLNVVSENGKVDLDGFIKLLDNFTSVQPSWNKAKARAVTTCLRRTPVGYDGECEINKILACTFDVLTENCPLVNKTDVCKHSNRQDIVCQISSSKYRPKYRRGLCDVPNFVSNEILDECGMFTLSNIVRAPETPIKTKKNSLFISKYQCKDQSLSTTCLMDKMGVLNKYTFMDYFKMKDKIRQFATQPQWSVYIDAYLSAFTNIPLYRNHCSSPKKLLNVVDAMLLTCPETHKQNTPQCKKVFKEMFESAPINQQNITDEKRNEILKHFHYVFFPAHQHTSQFGRPIRQKHRGKVIKNPLYDYGILNSGAAPKVQIIDVHPQPKPIILAPVYMRPQTLNPIARPYTYNGVLRSQPFWLHEQNAKAHLTSAASTVSPISPTWQVTKDFQTIMP